MVSIKKLKQCSVHRSMINLLNYCSIVNILLSDFYYYINLAVSNCIDLEIVVLKQYLSKKIVQVFVPKQKMDGRSHFSAIIICSENS